MPQGWCRILGLLLTTFSIVELKEEILYQPSRDMTFLKAYFRNDRLVDWQMRCLFRDDGPCDFVGRWIKPRLGDGLLGVCKKCTASQSQVLFAIIEYLKSSRPDFYEQAVRRFLTEEKLLQLIKLSNTHHDMTVDANIDRRLPIGTSTSPNNQLVPPRSNSTPAPWEGFMPPFTLSKNSSFSIPILPYS